MEDGCPYRSAAVVKKTVIRGGAHAENMACLELLCVENAVVQAIVVQATVVPVFPDGYDQLD